MESSESSKTIFGKSTLKSIHKVKTNKKSKKTAGFIPGQGTIADIETNTPEKYDGEHNLSCVQVSPATKKRKKDFPVPDDLDEVLEEEIEKQWDLKAEKNNLTVSNVKNIIKTVITNQYVVDIVRQTILQGGVTDMPFEPKLTRAKTRELFQQNPEGPLPPVVGLLTPLKVPEPEINPEIKLLIDEELPEDSSDEEYNPETEVLEQSDDDDKGDASIISDMDSLPPTPASLQAPPTPSHDCSQDSVFRVPQENVGQRTRSKLNLNRLPLETLERMLNPPDVTEDMYDEGCDNPDWQQFLKEFQQPMMLNETLEDDIENDPEYNILEDEVKLKVVDKEEMRKDKAVKVSKKELNALMKELFECSDLGSSDDEDVNQTVESIAALEESIMKETEDRQKREEQDREKLKKEELRKKEEMLRKEKENRKGFVPSQMLLLKQQLQQHVQLTTQHFLQTYKHPKYSFYAETCKTMLITLAGLKKDHLFSQEIDNLDAAVTTINKWINVHAAPGIGDRIKKFVMEQLALEKVNRRRKWSTFMNFPKELMEVVTESEFILYPSLLPSAPFKTTFKRAGPYSFTNSEDMLLALCLEQVSNLMKEKSHRFSSKKPIMKAKMIFDTCIPRSTPFHISRHIRAKKNSNIMNPIKALFEKGEPPVIVHCVIPVQPGMKLWQLPWHRIPPTWRTFLKNKHRLLFQTDIVGKENPQSNMSDATLAAEVNLEKMSIENKRPDKEASSNNKNNITSSIFLHSPTKEKVNNSNIADNKETVKEGMVDISTSCDEPKKLASVSKKLTWDQKQSADLRTSDQLKVFSPSPRKDKENENIFQNSLKPPLENVTKFENRFYPQKMTDESHSESSVGKETKGDKLKECEIKRSLKKKVTFCHDVESNYQKLQDTDNSFDGEKCVSKSDLGVKSMTKSLNLSLEKKCKEKKKCSRFFTQSSPPKVKFTLKFTNSSKYNSRSRLHNKKSKSIKYRQTGPLSDSYYVNDSFTKDTTEQEKSHSPKPPSTVKLKNNLINN